MLCVFVVLKLPHLSYPFYWDESWPYASAVRALATHGPSLMPNAIEADLSRGHPMLFHFFAALWVRLFGTSHVAMHTYPLLVSVLLLIAVYEIGLRLFGKKVGLMGVVLVALQEVVFVQSSLLLPEVQLALLGLLSLYLYATERYLYAGIALFMLFFTKESGVALGLVLGVDGVVSIFRRDRVWKMVAHKLLCVIAPTLLLGGFFLLNKHYHGWYIFPFHAQVIDHDWKHFWYKFRMGCMTDQFYTGYKYYYYLLLGVLAIAAYIKDRNWRYFGILIPILFGFYMLNDLRAGRILPSVPFFILFVISWGTALWMLAHRSMFPQPQQRRFIVLTGWFAVCFIAFSTMNYYTYRYMMVSIIPMLVVTAALFGRVTDALHARLHYLCLACFGGVAYITISTNKGFGDTDLGAFDAMDVQQHVVTYMEQNGYQDKALCVPSFVEQQHFLDPRTGFLAGSKKFKDVQWLHDEHTDFALFDNIEPDNRREIIMKYPPYKLVYSYKKGEVWGEVYKLK